uniref:Hepatocyte growth factor receptor-like n=1 Tax=Crassostrea virginica TaxID=6565 RepID=A0A8B8B4N1_CRAVI|nr:hepatocyte growth factor receptor-like [Crassostrea virginica]
MLFETKISRICKNDKYMRSFNEVVLECNRHNIATAAYYREAEEDSSLYVAFGISMTSTEASRNDSAVVCQYSQSDIETMFKNLITFCFNNADALSPPDWSNCNAESKLCDNSVQVDVNNYCNDVNAQRANQGIQRLKKPFYHPKYLIFEEKHTIFTSVFMHKVDLTKEVLWLGTIDGYILKVNLNQDLRSRRAFVRFDLSQNRSQQIQSHHIVPENDTEYIILLYGNKASKFPMLSCQVHTSCNACVQSNDPLGCGWCKDSCLRAEKCQTSWHAKRCPPFIDRVYPSSGPLKGGTLVTIDGEHFLENSNGTETKVEIGDVICKPVNVTNTKIVCYTSHAKTAGDFLVIVTSSMPSEVKEFNYSYKIPNLKRTNPSGGPRHGNTLLIFSGDNLDIGLQIKISIFNILCSIQRRNRTHLECTTNECLEIRDGSTGQMTCNECYPIKFTIDENIVENNDSFCYRGNPWITYISRNSTILSGGLTLRINGTYFDSANSYVLRLTNEDTRKNVDTNCNLFDSSGGQLICKTPDLPLEISRPGTKMKMVLLLVNDEFHWQMWRFKSVPVYMLVYPNPVFERFDTTDKTEVFASKMQFSIYGTNLNDVLKPEDYLIRVGNVVCPLQKLKHYYLKCDLTEGIEKHNLRTAKANLTIGITVGNIEMTIGDASFEPCK